VKSCNWKLFIALATLSTAWTVGQSQPPAPKPKPDAATPAAKPADALAGQEEQIPPAGPGAIFPAVVARVNGRAILGRDLEQRVRAQLAPIGNPAWQNLREDYRQELTNSALGSAVAEELIYEKAIAAGVKLPATDVQSEFAKVTKSFADDAAMNVALAARGLDRASLMRELERNLVIGKYINDNVTSKITVTPEEAAEYYKSHTEEFRHPDMVRTSHILIMVTEGATADQDRLARQRAEAILARARKGEDFAKLAQETSMDSSASQGGDIGYVTPGQVDPAYQAAAFSLAVGSLSDPVRSRVGYHIIKVTDKKKEGIATLDESRVQLTEFLKNQKSDRQLQQLVDQQRKEAKIEVLITVGPLPPVSPTASSPRP
jgi:parvulin-like peptidyl-prolyl isomerase